MNKTIVWVMLTCLMVGTLVLASCAPAPSPTATPGPTATVSPTATASPTAIPTAALGPEVPKYGGHFLGVWDKAPVNFDPITGSPARAYATCQTNENLLTGDWTKGPAGTGENPFWAADYVLSQHTGLLAQSWETPDPDTIIFHLRKGIHWHNKPPVNGRELTADDIVFNIKRFFDPQIRGIGSSAYPGWFVSATAADKYTIVVKGHDSETARTSQVFMDLGEYFKVMAPEVEKMPGGLAMWENSVGTGPFILTDYVSASSATLVKNPNYWHDDPLHAGNRLPYIDSQKWAIIPDLSTRIAALRTAKVDLLCLDSALSLEDHRSLLKTSPQLMYRGDIQPLGAIVAMRVDKPDLPIHDVRVRQALSMAIDYEAIKRDYYSGQAEILHFPAPPHWHGVYTPLDKLPASTKDLFTYNPEKAKRLLAEAGYPNGFKTTVVCTASSLEVDLLSIVKANWTKIGVDLTLDVKDSTVWSSLRLSKGYPEMIWVTQGTAITYKFVKLTTGDTQNFSMIDDPYIMERKGQIMAFENTENEAVKTKLANEIVLRTLDQSYYLQMPVGMVYNIWWPWVQNYRGENAVSYGSYYNFVQYIWVDQNLKKQMTGGR